MSYYEQELRTPDIGVLRSICVKYNISADYLLGIIPDQNHATSDVCRETGLSPEAAKKLRIINTLVNTEFHSHKHMVEVFDEDFMLAMQLAAATSLPGILNALLESDEGVSLLTLLGAIVLGAEIQTGENEPKVILKSASKNFEVAVPIDNLTAALWVNIQDHASNLRDRLKDEQPAQGE